MRKFRTVVAVAALAAVALLGPGHRPGRCSRTAPTRSVVQLATSWNG